MSHSSRKQICSSPITEGYKPQMLIEEFNALSESGAASELQTCCASERWVRAVVAQRPFDSVNALHAAAEAEWSVLAEADYLEAFDAHPKIGDPDSLKKKYANTHKMASGEQQLVEKATPEVIDALATINQAYQEKFGFIFIVCATGKSAQEMLTLVERRLPNDRTEEVTNAACEQAAITAIRLNKLFE